mmetsp:Transcript_24696/g.57370  ORF Transcript_24696/g.57370 Transcript_24696/m.57370 type:complete len:253 (+) Transcript_24696:229-987(+)
MAVGESASWSLHKYLSNSSLESSRSFSICSCKAGEPVSALTTANNGSTSPVYDGAERVSWTSLTSSKISFRNVWFAVRRVMDVTNFATMGGLRKLGRPWLHSSNFTNKLRIALTTGDGLGTRSHCLQNLRVIRDAVGTRAKSTKRGMWLPGKTPTFIAVPRVNGCRPSSPRSWTLRKLVAGVCNCWQTTSVAALRKLSSDASAAKVIHLRSSGSQDHLLSSVSFLLPDMRMGRATPASATIDWIPSGVTPLR